MPFFSQISSLSKNIPAKEIEVKIEEPVIDKKKLKCPHCKKIGGAGPMRRWHFDKCKSKKIVVPRASTKPVIEESMAPIEAPKKVEAPKPATASGISYSLGNVIFKNIKS